MSLPINDTRSKSINEFVTLRNEQFKSQEISGAVVHGIKYLTAVQPAIQDAPLQCLIVRDKKNSIFYLHAAASSSLTEKGKFLMAAHRSRHGLHTDYTITINPNDLSQGSNAYVGKLSSNFLGTKFSIYDSHPPHDGAKSRKSRLRFTSKQVSPQVPACNFKIGEVCYKYSTLKERRPRRMVASVSSVAEETEPELTKSKTGQILLRNKPPRWHKQLKGWCLNFHGRVTVQSVKNFQLLASVDANQPEGNVNSETILLQFGKVGDDLFTMDYGRPLSAFQAFAICLTSFETKVI